MDSNMRRDIILSHYQNPTNKGLIENDEYIHHSKSSSSCIDSIELMVKVNDGIIEDIRFDGEACAICTSATSIMIESLIGKTIEEAKNIIDNYNKMINEEAYDKQLLGELNVYDEIYKQPNRKNCALLPIDTMNYILKEVK